MIHTICFFNYYHNGDVFSGKGYMQDIMAQLQGVKFQHAQLNSLKTMQDLACEHVHTDAIHSAVNHQMRYVDLMGVLYINTWVGAYGGAVILPGHEHANWISLNTMWMHIYDMLDQAFNIKLHRVSNLLQYVPTTDWQCYDTAAADRWLGQHENIALMCNGLVRSTQSLLGSMEDIIVPLALENPGINFVCTSRFAVDHAGVPNVFFTDDIFSSVTGGDINEIAYLSTRAFMIMGKNSGPFMFCHVKQNIMDANKIFFSMSHRSSDSYSWGCQGLACHYLHYSQDDAANAAGVLREALALRGQVSAGSIQELGVLIQPQI